MTQPWPSVAVRPGLKPWRGLSRSGNGARLAGAVLVVLRGSKTRSRFLPSCEKSPLRARAPARSR